MNLKRYFPRLKGHNGIGHSVEMIEAKTKTDWPLYILASDVDALLAPPTPGVGLPDPDCKMCDGGGVLYEGGNRNAPSMECPQCIEKFRPLSSAEAADLIRAVKAVMNPVSNDKFNPQGWNILLEKLRMIQDGTARLAAITTAPVAGLDETEIDVLVNAQREMIEEHAKAYGVTGLVPLRPEHVRALLSSPAPDADEQYQNDPTRECDQCGRHPNKGWKSWQCPGGAEFGSCDGKIQPLRAPTERGAEAEAPNPVGWWNGIPGDGLHVSEEYNQMASNLPLFASPGQAKEDELSARDLLEQAYNIIEEYQALEYEDGDPVNPHLGEIEGFLKSGKSRRACREWDAETIKDAPGYADIDFDKGEIGSMVECYRIKYKGDRDYRTFQKSLASVIVEFERGIIDRAFGPIPQPPQADSEARS